MRVLLIEGGGMKAAYANGVLTAFEQAGYRPWDAVVGTSAGGALAAWYSAGQAEYAQGTWKYASDPRILSAKRMLGGGPLLDHERLLDLVYVDEHPLDVAAVSRAPWPVIVTAADVDSGHVVYQDIRGADVLAWLKATGRLPLQSGPPVHIGGRKYVDGGVVDPIPVRYVCDQLGATHVTLIINKPPKAKRSDNRLVAHVAAKKFPALRKGILDHDRIKAESYAFAASPPPNVQIDIIEPSQPTHLHRLSRDQAKLAAAMDLGRHDGREYVEKVNV